MTLHWRNVICKFGLEDGHYAPTHKIYTYKWLVSLVGICNLHTILLRLWFSVHKEIKESASKLSVFKDQEKGNQLPLTSQTLVFTATSTVAQKDAIENDRTIKPLTWNLKDHIPPPSFSIWRLNSTCMCLKPTHETNVLGSAFLKWLVYT